MQRESFNSSTNCMRQAQRGESRASKLLPLKAILFSMLNEGQDLVGIRESESLQVLAFFCG